MNSNNYTTQYSFDNVRVFSHHNINYGKILSAVFMLACLYICAFMFAFSFCFTSSEVRGASMVPALNNYSEYESNRHDIVYVNKLVHYSHADIVVLYNASIGKNIVKRVIGMPGDTINIVFNDGKYYVERNGVPLDEDAYLNQSSAWSYYNGMDVQYTKFITYKQNNQDKLDFVDPSNPVDSAIRVPQGQIFVLGDNRRVSEDSSHTGCFDISNVVGKVELVVYDGQSPILVLLNYLFNPFKDL